MNSLLLLIGVSLGFVVAYHVYGRFLARHIFCLQRDAVVPSQELRDDQDFVPTRKVVLFGHHFASIAGIGPIVGPAIGVIWGWGPALAWIFFGSIFFGAVHDFGALVLSLRGQGRSIGDLAADYVNARVRILFFIIIFFALWIIIAIFALIIALLFGVYPQSVLPVWMQIPIALVLGRLMFQKKMSPHFYGVMAVGIMYVTIFWGSHFPFVLPDFLGFSSLQIWIGILLAYAFVASVLPVQVLLQPRDFINAYQLLITMAVLMAAVVVTHPKMVAPVYQLKPAGAPPMWPTLFTIIACGAISGFHSLVSSGTSSKQCAGEPDALFVGFGAMLTEGILATLVVVAIAGGLGLGLKTESGQLLRGAAAFTHHYADWPAANGLAAKLNAFVVGGSNILSGLRVPPSLSFAAIGVFIVSFAATTLDSATRIQRYVISELTRSWNIAFFQNKYGVTFVAVMTAFVLAFSNGSGKGALTLWPLFGAVNQLLAGLSLLVITVYLAHQCKPIWCSAIPMVCMIVITAWAMGWNIHQFFGQANWLLFFIGMSILILEIWMVAESFWLLRNMRRVRSR